MTVLSPAELAARATTAFELAQRATTLVADPEGRPDRSLKDGVADWVTSTDLAVERLVRAVLGQRFPDDAIVGEELENAPFAAGHPVWYVDPVDGTTNFANGLRWCSFSLALADGAGMAVGMVADVWHAEIFSAARGQGARCHYGAGPALGRGTAPGEGPVGRSEGPVGWREVPTHCRRDTSLAGGVVLTELAGTVPWEGMTGLLEELGRQWCATRLLGSSALCLASVGAGRASAAVLGRANPIDVAAGALIAHESGAVVHVAPHVDRVLDFGPVRLGPGPNVGPGELGPGELVPGELGPGPALVACAPGVYAQVLRSSAPHRRRRDDFAKRQHAGVVGPKGPAPPL